MSRYRWFNCKHDNLLATLNSFDANWKVAAVVAGPYGGYDAMDGGHRPGFKITVDTGQAEAHHEEIAVDTFAQAMKVKLDYCRKRGRSGGLDKDQCSREYLSDMLRACVEKGDPVDVANLAMMLFVRGETIAKPERSAMLDWAVSKWESEVKHRPLMNVHRRSLDDSWRQVIRYAGGDPVSLVGPPHDELLATREKEHGRHDL